MVDVIANNRAEPAVDVVVATGREIKQLSCRCDFLQNAELKFRARDEEKCKALSAEHDRLFKIRDTLMTSLECADAKDIEGAFHQVEAAISLAHELTDFAMKQDDVEAIGARTIGARIKTLLHSVVIVLANNSERPVTIHEPNLNPWLNAEREQQSLKLVA